VSFAKDQHAYWCGKVDVTPDEIVLAPYSDTYLAETTYKGKPFKERCFTVTVRGQVIGYIFHELVTRETRSKGKMYVDRRWQSPGWRFSEELHKSRRRCEAGTKLEAVTALVRMYEPSKETV
jgi:hypothetical protein